MKANALAILLLASVAASTSAPAQSSASYELSEHVLNAGGAPDGNVPSSAGYRTSLVAIGDAAGGAELSSASHGVSVGFVAAYPPPGEAVGLRFDDASTLSWDDERSAGTYNLYRDLLGSLAGLGYGDCEQTGLTSASTTDTDTPTAGDGYFYLVTAENRLDEEGTKGFDGGGTERAGTACP